MTGPKQRGPRYGPSWSSWILSIREHASNGPGFIFFLPIGDGLHERRVPPPPWFLLGGDGGGDGGGLAFLMLPSYNASRLSRLLVGRGGSWRDLLLCPWLRSPS